MSLARSTDFFDRRALTLEGTRRFGQCPRLSLQMRAVRALAPHIQDQLFPRSPRRVTRGVQFREFSIPELYLRTSDEVEVVPGFSLLGRFPQCNAPLLRQSGDHRHLQVPQMRAILLWGQSG